jgi:hypothetical protein
MGHRVTVRRASRDVFVRLPSRVGHRVTGFVTELARNFYAVSVSVPGTETDIA